MAITTIRPNATRINVGPWANVGGAGSLHAATSDDSDATYGQANNENEVLEFGFASQTPGAGLRRHAYRVRVRRASSDLATPVPSAFRARVGDEAVGSYIQVSIAGIGTTNGPWVYDPPMTGAVTTWRHRSVQLLLGPSSSADFARVYEAYIDIDQRLAPTFTPDILDAAGVSRASGTVTDTNSPFLTFGTINYDGLPARMWSVTVYSTAGSVVVFADAGLGPPPASIRIPSLVNGAYTADLQVFSTIRINNSYSSDIETVGWTQNFTAPVPPVGTAVVDACAVDGPNVQVCWTEDTPGAVTFDSEPVIEIVRSDCNGERTVYVGAPLEGCFCDRTMSINEPGFFCGERATQGLRLIGSGNGRIQTPDSVPLSIVGDIEIEADIAIDWQSEFKSRVVRKSGSFAVDIGNWEEGTKRIIFLWVDSAVSVSVRSTVGIPMEYMERAKIKVTHDVNDGAGSRVTRFYIDRGAGFVELGDPVVFGTAGDIDDTANALEFGSASTPQAPRGYFYSLTVRNGIGGTIVASPDVTDPSQGWIIGDDVGDTGTDAQGNVWTISGFAGVSVQLESCLVSYRMRYWGLVAGVLVSTDWEFVEAVAVENPEPGNDWVHGATEWDMSICPDRGYPMVRPFGSFQPIGGGLPTVISGAPGGRDYALQVAVTSEADQKLLEAILAQTLVFYHPAGADSLWLAPRTQQTQVVKVGRIRTTSVEMVAVNPQPQPDPASFF